MSLSRWATTALAPSHDGAVRVPSKMPRMETVCVLEMCYAFLETISASLSSSRRLWRFIIECILTFLAAPDAYSSAPKPFLLFAPDSMWPEEL